MYLSQSIETLSRSADRSLVDLELDRAQTLLLIDVSPNHQIVLADRLIDGYNRECNN